MLYTLYLGVYSMYNLSYKSEHFFLLGRVGHVIHHKKSNLSVQVGNPLNSEHSFSEVELSN